MKLVLKNSELVFKNKIYTEVALNSVLNTPTGFYVASGKVIAGTPGQGTNLYVNVYAVTAGTTYYLKSTEWIPNSERTSINIVSAFGTNLLTGAGNISDNQNVAVYNPADTSVNGILTSFTPAQNGYIYVSTYDYPSAPCVLKLKLYT